MRCLIVVAVAVLGVAGQTASMRASEPNPQALVVTAHDVSSVYGPGFTRFLHEVVSNEQIGTLSATPALTVKVYQGEGRITGYATAFRRVTKRPAVYYVYCEVDVYQAAAGPIWRLNYARQHPDTIQAGFTVHPVHEGTTGDGGYYASFAGRPAGSAAAKIYGASLSFRRGRYLATITVSSPAPLDSRSVYRIGDLVDGRLRHAG